MKILISIASTYKKGDRIIINAGTPRKPEYYLCTITVVRAGKWYIRYDDGDKGDIDDIKDIVGIAVAKKYTKSFGKADLKKYMLESVPSNTKRIKKLVPKSKIVKPTESLPADALKQLADYVEGEDYDERTIFPETINAAKVLHSYSTKPEFAKLLKVPPSTPLYRGMPFSFAKLEKLRDAGIFDKPIRNSIKWNRVEWLVFDYEFEAKSKFSSWTTSYKAASHFSLGSYGEVDVPVSYPKWLYFTIHKFLPVIITSRSDPSFFGSRELIVKHLNNYSNVNYLAEISDEGEIFRYGNKIKKVRLNIPKKLFNEWDKLN